MRMTALSVILCAGLVAGCSNKPTGEPVAAAEAPAAAASSQSGAPAGGSTPQSFTGVVVETMDVLNRLGVENLGMVTELRSEKE